MNKQEVIELLEKRRNAAFDGMERFAVNTDLHTLHGARVHTYDIAIDKVKQIEEPKQDKPVVKQCVADWYEGNEWDLEENIFAITVEIYNKGAQTEFENWFNASDTKPFETLIKMKLFGYTVGQPKWWVVRHESGKFFEKFTGNGTNRAWVVWKNQAYLFDDKSKAEAVATLVEGTVEEV